MASTHQFLLGGLAALSLLVGGVACGDKGTTGGDDTGRPPRDGGTDDTGTDGGATEEDPRNGDYRGVLTVRIIEPKGKLIDICAGTSNIRVDLSQKQQLVGTASCRFGGDLAKVYPDAYVAEIVGENEKGEFLSGGMSLNFGAGSVVADDWTGSFLPEQQMKGNFDGNTMLSGGSFDYTGGFEATKLPPKKGGS